MKRATILTRPLRSAESYVVEKQKSQESNSVGELSLDNNSPPQMKKNKESQVARILGMATELSPTERRNLLAQLALGEKIVVGEETRDLDMWAGAVYEAVVEAVGGGGEGVPGPALVRRLLSTTNSWANVQSFMRAAKFDSLNVVERQAVYVMLAGLVVEHARYVARTSRAPLSVKLVANCAVNITGIFDQSFPGYVASGIAHIVARRLTTGQIAANQGA